ncbi:MAG: hypothetical protein Aurels2KO_54340 [Aureliella sp.]
MSNSRIAKGCVDLRVVAIVALVLTFANCATLTIACDYTVRDIGFVPLEKPRYTLMIVGDQSHELDEDTVELAGRWGLQTLCVTWKSARDLPVAIQAFRETSSDTTTVWLVDHVRRCLLLDELVDPPAKLALSAFLREQLETDCQLQLHSGATRSFAQIILFEGEPPAIDQARKAAAALREIEPMLPRPISMPAQVVVVPEDQRQQNRILLWALGVDELESAENVMGVLYGRGRLAGPVMLGEAITHERVVAQLALVGESCECETDRDWLDERSLPFYWDEEQDWVASGILGFDPGNVQVQAEVRRVIARGKRQNQGRSGDTIERIVASYMESQVEGYQQPVLEIPPGSKNTELAVNATVIQGDGWGFDTVSPSGPHNSPTDEASDSVVYRPRPRGDLPVDEDDQMGWGRRSSGASVRLWVVGIAAFVACLAIWRAAR